LINPLLSPIETQTAPAAPLDLVTLMGGFEECSSWLLSYTASTNQYCRNENDVYNKIKREFSVFTEKEEVLKELRGIADKVRTLNPDMTFDISVGLTVVSKVKNQNDIPTITMI